MQSPEHLWLSKADPRATFIWFLVLTLATVVPMGGYTFTLATVPLIALLGGLHKSTPWLALFAMPLLLLTLGIASFITATESPVLVTAFIVIRWAAMIYGSLFFVVMLDPQETYFLIRWVRLPAGFGIALFFALRTVPTTLEQLQGLVRAMQARGLWPIGWSWRASGQVLRLLPELLIALLFASIRRTDQMWIALELRGGWDRMPTIRAFTKSTSATLFITGHTAMMLVAILLGLGEKFLER